jgi:hypothetical protein
MNLLVYLKTISNLKVDGKSKLKVNLRFHNFIDKLVTNIKKIKFFIFISNYKNAL